MAAQKPRQSPLVGENHHTTQHNASDRCRSSERDVSPHDAHRRSRQRAAGRGAGARDQPPPPAHRAAGATARRRRGVGCRRCCSGRRQRVHLGRYAPKPTNCALKLCVFIRIFFLLVKTILGLLDDARVMLPRLNKLLERTMQSVVDGDSNQVQDADVIDVDEPKK
jgi:hypothetical protein